MLKAIGAAVVFALIVCGALAVVVMVMSPPLRQRLKRQLKTWKDNT